MRKFFIVVKNVFIVAIVLAIIVISVGVILTLACQHTGKTYCVVLKEATCNTAGEVEYRCEWCDDRIKTETVEATGEHDWVSTPAVAPTCTSVGWEEGFQCSVCAEKKAVMIEKVSHTIQIVSGSEATCEKSGLTDGEYCTGCKQWIVPQIASAPLGHYCGVYSNTCERCDKSGVYGVIDTFNDLAGGASTSFEGCIYYLEYCLGDREGEWYLSIPSSMNYLRFVGNPNTTYDLFLIIKDRFNSIKIDFVDVNLSARNTLVSCTSKVDVEIGFYGRSASLIAQKASEGTRGTIRDGKNGGTGATGGSGISVSGNLTIRLGANKCRIEGGSGGDGGKGCDGHAAIDSGNGGNGGNGGMGIRANSITVIVEDGYSSSNLTIVGGAGGYGGAGGKGTLTKDGKRGTNGSSAAATSCKIIYK